MIRSVMLFEISITYIRKLLSIVLLSSLFVEPKTHFFTLEKHTVSHFIVVSQTHHFEFRGKWKFAMALNKEKGGTTHGSW